MTENQRSGREPIEVVQITQDQCTLTYGSAPCTASIGTGGRKCFNTRATCQDPDNYDRGTITLRFCKNQGRIPNDGNYYFPFLKGVSVTPGKINPGGGAGSVSALGLRSTISCTFLDAPSNDRFVDPYVDDRDYDPLTRSTFWPKWRARNPYYQNRELKYISGYLNDSGQIVDSVTRTFFMDSISGPDNRATVEIKAKDVLSLANDRKAKAPAASTGTLSAGISAAATSATLTPAGVGNSEYPASGWVRIGSEVASFTRSGDTLTLTRGQFNTAAVAHSAGDAVQLCLRYSGQSPHTILEDLLTNYAGIDSAYLDTTAWATEVSSYLPRLYSTLITEPTGVAKLVAEMSEQMYFYIWWDERNDLVKMRAVRPAEDDTIYQLTGSRHLVKDSVLVRDLEDQRLTQVIVYYGVRDYTKDLDEPQNYSSAEKIINDNGGTNKYQTEAVKIVKSRWIDSSNGAAAIDLGNKLLARYGSTPKQVSFALDAKDRDVWVGAFAQISSSQNVTDEGEELPINCQVFEARETIAGTIFEYVGQEFVFETDLVEDNQLDVIISGSQNNINLRDIYDNQYVSAPVSGDTVTVTIRSGVVIGSTSTGSPGLSSGSWPAGVTVRLVVEAGAYVVGAAGSAGAGQDITFGVTAVGQVNGTNGTNGGPAMNITNAITINNLGVIGGGGGGGAGGTGFCFSSGAACGGGGGGGAGRTAGNGAVGGNAIGYSAAAGQDGPDGTGGALEAGGGGGELSGSYGIYSNALFRGGDGGDLGQAGEDGQTINSAGASGGSAGNAVTGVSSVTWENKGDVRGPEA